MAQNSTGATDFAQSSPKDVSTLSAPRQTAQLNNGSSAVGDSSLQRATSSMSQSHTLTPSRGGTLKKRQSLSRKGSTKRAGSIKGSRPGSVKSLTFADDVGGNNAETNSAFFTPVPTSGNPTEILANRFQVWRKVLKDLITYFRDIQKSYDSRSKTLYTLSNVIANISAPPQLATEGGINDAINILRDYHKQSITEGNKAKSIEEEVIVQLTGLRSDLGQKIKEIKGLSGDFKNSVDKETENTRRAVRDLQEALRTAGSDAKSDPFLVRLGVDRQVGRQIEEENYLHRAFLNLESSGRELESIVMGEIQKAYNAYAGIIKREADDAYETVEKLRDGPLAIQKDYEWNSFVNKNDNFVDPKLAVRKVANISYPGRDDPAASEVKAGMLERKSKYLKSYTPGWYVLSTTHLHEFKSPDRIYSQTPIMSLPLADQKLGSHSNTDSTSHKFMLKGRQSGGIHRGHAWVFRAESYDTMMAWFSDIKNLTEKTGAERNAFIQRSHARSLSAGSNNAASVSSDDRAMDEDEADQVPYSATASQASVVPTNEAEKPPQRPTPGGRFPSALNINRDSQVPLSASSPSSSGDAELVAAAGALPGSDTPFGTSGQQVGASYGDTSAARGGLGDSASAAPDPYGSPISPISAPLAHQGLPQHGMNRHDSNYGDWMTPTAAGVGGAAASTAGIDAYRRHQEQQKAAKIEEQPGLQAVEAAPSALVSSTTQPQTLAAPAAPPTQNAILEAASVQSSSTIDGTSLIGVQGTHAIAADPAAPIKNLTNLSDPGEPVRELASRPPLGDHTDSVASISDLHMPGDFPETPAL